MLGGIEQWVTIRGENRDNPVLLVLHGGPGDATNPWGYAGFRSWLKTFTIVQWDQRGAGKTLGRNGPSLAPTITIERLTQDGVELAELLRRSLKKDKLVLLGHSWGSTLGVFMVKARPNLFYAFVGTGQVVDSARNYAVVYDQLLRKAKEVENNAPCERLRRSARRRMQTAGGTPFNAGGPTCSRVLTRSFRRCSARPRRAWLLAPGRQRLDRGAEHERSAPDSSDEHPNPTKLAGEFAVPIVVIQGSEDFTTPTSLARSWVDSIKAPRKAFTLIEGGHFAVFMKPQAFLNELVRRVLPLIKDR